MTHPKFRFTRPTAGHPIIPLAASFLLFATTACNSSSTAPPDSWRLTPPELIGTTSDGSPNKLAANKTSAATSVLHFNLESYMKFAKPDRGLSLEFETQCDSMSHHGQMITSEFVSLARMLPPLLLGNDTPPSTCLISISVKNTLGSIHRFRLENIRLSASTTERALNEGQRKQMASQSQDPLRIVCGKWWVEEDPESVNASLTFDKRIVSLAGVKSVNASDDRDRRFRPLCRVFQLRGESELGLVTTLTLKLPGLETKLTKSVVLDPSTHYTFLNKPLVEWDLENISNQRQVIFISKRIQTLKMSYANVMSHYGLGWSRMISVPYEFQFSGSYQYLETNDGTFIELPAGRSLKMQLKLNRNAHCMISFGRNGTPYLRFEMGTPIQYSVLDQDVPMNKTSLESAKPAADAMKALFSSQVLEFENSNSPAKDGGTFEAAEKQLGAGLQLPYSLNSQCFHGQMFEGPESSRRPIVD